jgi:hypothetical protein
METLLLRFAFMHTRTMSRVQREYGSILQESNLSAIDRIKKELDELRMAESVQGGDFQPDHRSS